MEFIKMYNSAEKQTFIVQHEPRSSTSRAARIALIILTLLVIPGSGFLIFYTTVLHPTELKVQATAVVSTILASQAQATITNSPQSLYTQLTNKTPTLNNPLNIPTDGWDTGKQKNNSCAFNGGAYHILANSERGYFTCQDESSQYSNFVFQVQMTILNGNNGGIFFRSTNQGLIGDTFSITSNGIYLIAQTTNSSSVGLSLFGRDTNLHSSTKQPVLITVIARETHLSFYINKQFINAIDDNTFSTGTIGLFTTNPELRARTDVAFNNAQLWVL